MSELEAELPVAVLIYDYANKIKSNKFEIPYAKQWSKIAGVPEGTLRDNIKVLLKMLEENNKN